MAEHGYVSVPIAAKRLGVSERTVRHRARNGALDAMMVGRSWLVRLPPLADDGNVPVPVAAADGGNGNAAATVADGGNMNLAPLAQLLDDLTRRHDERIAELTRENRQLAEAAAVWQERARGLEERVLALTALTVPDVPISRQDARSGAEGPAAGHASLPRRLWRRLTGTG